MRFTVLHKRPNLVRWCMTPLLATPGKVEAITEPLLPRGKLLDELGQSTLHDWPGKTRSLDELKQRILSQWENAAQAWPEEFSRWVAGNRRSSPKARVSSVPAMTEGAGLVDPEGYAFWSAGLDCVRADTEASMTAGIRVDLAS